MILDGDDAPGETAVGSAAAAASTETKAPKADSVVLGAVALARAAALDEATEPGTPGTARVGEHLGAVMDAERVALHRFTCTDPGYAGWVWTVQLSRVPRAKVATIDDVLLLPGDGSLLAPAWVPYDERIRPGDLGVGDVLSTAVDDPRLVLSGCALPPAFADVDADIDEALWWELGLGRPRVLSAWGRDDAAERWWEGDAGPEAAIARAATGACVDCGFFIGLNGGLGRLFGVCGNELAPDDGRVVATEHGCGAHSEAVVEVASRWADLAPADELEQVDVATLPDEAETTQEETAQAETARADVDLAALVEPELAAEPVVDSASEPEPEPEPDLASEPAPEAEESEHS